MPQIWQKAKIRSGTNATWIVQATSLKQNVIFENLNYLFEKTTPTKSSGKLFAKEIYKNKTSLFLIISNDSFFPFSNLWGNYFVIYEKLPSTGIHMKVTSIREFFQKKSKLESTFDCFLIYLDPNSHWIAFSWWHQNFPENFVKHFPKNLKLTASWLGKNSVWGIRVTAGGVFRTQLILYDGAFYGNI